MLIQAKTTMKPSREGEFALRLAKAAGTMMKDGLRNGLVVRTKPDGTLVTETEEKINDMVLTEVRREYPWHDFLGEEKSNRKKSRYQWGLDPTDGTGNFVNKIKNCAFSLQLGKDGFPILGVVYNPFTDTGELFYGEAGKGAFLNCEPIKVSENGSIKGSLIAISNWNSSQLNMTELSVILEKKGADMLRLGTITLQVAMVASGQLTAFLHPAKSPWDTGAAKVIVEEAGGVVTDLFGNNQKYDGSAPLKGCIVSNGRVHAELVREVHDFMTLMRS